MRAGSTTSPSRRCMAMLLAAGLPGLAPLGKSRPIIAGLLRAMSTPFPPSTLPSSAAALRAAARRRGSRSWALDVAGGARAVRRARRCVVWPSGRLGAGPAGPGAGRPGTELRRRWRDAGASPFAPAARPSPPPRLRRRLDAATRQRRAHPGPRAAGGPAHRLRSPRATL